MRPERFRAMWKDTSSKSWLVEIDDLFLQSAVSYYGLNDLVPHYSRASALVKGRSVDLSDYTPEQLERLASSCRLLYGLLHQRYITSEDGIDRITSKYQHGVYGRCPRVACKGKNTLIPMGLTIEPGVDTVKLWCTSCHDVYECDSKLDGAFFGPDLPVMFHKLRGIPLRFAASSDLLKGYRKSDGTEVPEVEKRLVRWGETRAACH